MSVLAIDTAEVFEPLLADARYKGAHGGRGSGKSHNFADNLIEKSLMQPGLRAVCIREVQKSLEQSVKRLLEDKIEQHKVGSRFSVMESVIRTQGNGIILFQGMQNHTADSIKSLEGFDIAWFEEAQNCSERSLRLLRPTIRKDPTFKGPQSELWFSWNPDQPTDPIDKLLRGSNPPPDSVVVEANWKDNPWFPKVLVAEKDYDYQVDPDSAAHVWGGEYWVKSDAQVLAGKYSIEEFEPVTSGRAPWDGPYFGADWGFANDPTTLVKCWLRPDGALMIEREAYRLRCDLLDTPQLFEEVEPKIRDYMIYADCARPETIHHMAAREGFRCEPAEKWQGSVEDGVSWLRGRPKIIIHPRCLHAAKEAKLWRYRTDRLTDLVLPALVDGNDNIWDAVRYAMWQIIRIKGHFNLANVS